MSKAVPLVMYQGEVRTVVGEAVLTDNGTDLIVSAQLFPEHIPTVLGQHTEHFSIVPEGRDLLAVPDHLDYSSHVHHGTPQTD